MATPAVPSALRPNAPPSELKAPGRLVTTTAAGADAAAAGSGGGGAGAPRASPGPLVIPEAVDSTGHPFWRELLSHIESADGARSPAPGAAAPPQRAPQFLSAFTPAALQRLLPAMPASVLTALVDGMAAADTPPACRAAYLRCLQAAVQALAAVAEEAAGDASQLSASQQVWQPRGQPLPASLLELAREVQLLPGLQAAVGDGNGGSTAAAAADVARALLGSEAARAAVAAAAAERGAGLQQGLEALAQAQAA